MGLKQDLKELYSYTNTYLRWLVVLVISLGFFHEMKPSEPYITTYLNENKGFTMDQINNDIYTVYTYAWLVFLPLVGLTAEILGYELVLMISVCVGQMATRLLLLYGTELWHMQLMQVTFGLAESGKVAFDTILYRFFPHHIFQTLTGMVNGTGLFSHLIGSLLGQLLVSLDDINLYVLMQISLASICVAAALSIAIFVMVRIIGSAKLSTFQVSESSASLSKGKKDEAREAIALRKTSSDEDVDISRYADEGNAKNGVQAKELPSRFEERVSFIEAASGSPDLDAAAVPPPNKRRTPKELAVEFWTTLKVCYSTFDNSMWSIQWSLTYLSIMMCEGYGASIWQERNPELRLNGAVSCLGWGLGGVTGLLPGHFGERLMRPNVSILIGVLQLIAAALLFIQAWMPNPGAYLTAYVIFEAVSYFLLAHFAAGVAIMMQRKGQKDFALVFAVNMFISVALQSLLQFVENQKGASTYNRFVSYGVIQGGVAMLTFIHYFVNKSRKRDPSETDYDM
eukprot:Clim_evm118s147 gene=Clim_evmTU118s147